MTMIIYYSHLSLITNCQGGSLSTVLKLVFDCLHRNHGSICYLCTLGELFNYSVHQFYNYEMV